MFFGNMLCGLVAFAGMVALGLKVRLPLITIAMVAGTSAVFVWLSGLALADPGWNLGFALLGISAGSITAHIARPAYLQAHGPHQAFRH
jgi:hypothetical protein